MQGSVGAAILLFVCCLVGPLLLGVAGASAIGLEIATVAAIVLAAVLVIRHRRSCGATGCSSASTKPTPEEA